MRRLFLVLLWPILPLVRAEPAAAPDAQIVPGETEAAWQPLFAALAAQGSIWSTFTENRWFPFRNRPVVLKGEMRFSPTRGLSLDYREPEERTVIADSQGLAMRDPQGRTREAPRDPRATGPVTALLPILRFDLVALERTFVLQGTRDGGAWRLEFVARDPGLARILGTIVVSGEDTTVRRLEFRRSPKERVEILIGGPRTGVTFTPDEERRYFR
jgi:Outer membrane lipoprotein carrier protein LolA-like